MPMRINSVRRSRRVRRLKRMETMSKTAFITGAGGYLGSEAARTLARAGITVAVSDVNEAAVSKTVEQITRAGGTAKGYVADVTKQPDVDAAIRAAVSDFGRLDILVYVAGGSARIASRPEKPASYLPLIDQDLYVIEHVIEVNLMGAIYACRTAGKIMVEQGEGGKILLFSSIVGSEGLANVAEYGAAKGGINSLVRALAKELGPYQINVNSIAPGVVNRPDSQDIDRATRTNVFGRACTAADVANLVEFLVSDKAGFITGQNYIIDGGRSIAMKGSD